MPAKKYVVRFDSAERQYLNTLVKTGKSAAYKRQRAQILLKANVGQEGPGLKDHEIARQLDLSQRTLERTRQRLLASCWWRSTRSLIWLIMEIYATVS